MAIILFDSRPAIPAIGGSFETPEPQWAHLGDPEIRPLLEHAIPAVGQVTAEGSQFPFLSTAFAVGPGLALTMGLPDDVGTQLSVVFDEGEPIAVDERTPLTVGGVACELLRLWMPDEVVALPLSSLTMEALAGSEVVTIGYPQSDSRNDPAAMQRIFKVRWGTKQLMPGRLTGLDDTGALLHDCSTLGGCGGAPLVHTATGEVVGMHYSGIYLKTNRAVPATAIASQLTSLLDGRRPRARGSATSIELSPATPTIADIGSELELPVITQPDVQPEPALAPMPADRPAASARNWRESLPGDWRDVLMPHEFRVDTAVRAVGRVVDESAPAGWIGTAFLVAPRLALTASFVAQAFAEGSGRRVTLKNGHKPGVDFSDALAVDSVAATVAVTGVRFIHPYFQVALLELDETPDGVTQLELAARLPAGLSSRPVVLISCGLPKTLVVQPGQALQVGELPDPSRLPVLAHDCVSGSGSAGGPVVDLGTGYVIGLHSHGQKGDGAHAGFAQPAWELARDPVLWDGSLGFRPDPKPPWLERWGVAGAIPDEVRPMQPEPQHWTVDRVPIDWGLQEPKDLERLLVATIDPQSALFEAENAGLPLGRVDRGQAAAFLWRELLKTAAVAGLLRRFLENIASNAQYDGIEPQLRIYL